MLSEIQNSHKTGGQSTLRDSVACHVCGSIKSAIFLLARGYSVVRCTECGLIFVNPQPSDAELAELYASHDQEDQWRVHEEHFNRAVRKEITRFRRTGLVLDVGCGSGNFLREMRTAGFSTVGVERSQSGWAYAVRYHGLDVFHGPIEQFFHSRPKASFDVVTLLNVLEHVKQPRATLEALSKILNEGGLLVAVVPDARFHALLATCRRLFGSKDPFWMEAAYQPIVAIDPPFHLTCFEPRTLRSLVEGSGYHVLKISNAPVISNPQLWKRASKLAIAATGRSLELLSLRTIVIGYSTIVVAKRR